MKYDAKPGNAGTWTSKSGCLTDQKLPVLYAKPRRNVAIRNVRSVVTAQMRMLLAPTL